MTAVGDFPSNCSTNTIILQDFGEVAYIVCTVSIPPQSHNAAQSSSPESVLARLRQTEQQFRQASILASIDGETQQLFTFYKKVDVLKDQRTILNKFGQILRSSSCTISYKAAARAADLFKAENSRIYRLFVTAVLASVNVVTDDGRAIIPLGPRYHAIQLAGNSAQSLSHDIQAWSLLRTDIQMVLSGQIVLTISEQRKLVPLVGLEQNSPYIPASPSKARPIPVVLAPTGQLAIYRHGWIGRISDYKAVPEGLTSRLKSLLRIWQNLFADWAQREPFAETQADDLWIELIIPVQEQTPSDPPDSPSTPKKPEGRSAMSFKSLFWPAKSCFAFDALTTDSVDPHADTDYDPVQFILEWFETMKEGDLNLKYPKDLNELVDNDDASVFPDDSAFDHAETFQPFGPPIFPASQTVYPTPPDVVMTHATPAMSSIDGLAATPATVTRSIVEVNENRQQQAADAQENVDIDVDVGSGLYDEDLFEDMPDDNFGHATAGDEPNWDFFDKPTNEAEGVDPMEVDPLASSPDIDAAQAVGDEMQSEQDQTPPLPVPLMNENEKGTTLSGATAQETQPVPATMELDDNLDNQPSHVILDQTSARRRSSVFDGVERPIASPKRDHRYTATGSFYFDARRTSRQPSSPRDLSRWIRRSPSPSTSSGSEHSGYETPIDADSPLDFKIQTPGKMQEECSPMASTQGDPIDAKEHEQEAKSVFELVTVPLTRATLDEAIVIGKPVGLGPQFDKPAVRNGFAHEIVYQITQTSLLHAMYATSTLTLGGADRNSVSFTGSTLAEGTVFSSLSNLCALSTPANAKGPSGRTARLLEPEVTMKRLDKQITARPAILPFWDTLGLQPHPNSKDVTAFCLHPYGQGVADSCLDFLDRIADAYVSCNLGQHKTGQIAGVTTNGLLEADPSDHGMYLGPVRRLGEALAKPTKSGGTLIVYLIASSDHDMAFVHCSVASYAIRRHVEQGWAKRSEQLNLVFQVVPPSFVASSQEVVVPSQSEYNTLALGVYSRIPPFETETSLGICEYPLILPDGRDDVNFDLEAGMTSPLSRHGAHLHLCYAFSDDRRWVVAAWTDQRGSLAFSMPYQIKTNILGPPRPIDDIIKDMWTVSQELMAKHRNKWRLIVARIGTIEAPEVNAWMSASNAPTANGKVRCSLYLLSVELRPTFRLFPQGETVNAGQNAYGTPASTPQGGITSPEQVVAATPSSVAALNAPTPPEHGFDPNADSDLSLADPSEESWAVILPYGVNQSKDILEIRPAVASGYLVKRLGPREEGGMSMLGAHMVWPTPNVGSTSQGQREDEVEEFLNDFRGLVTLASARGCIDSGRSCVPWHIHTATAGATALGKLI